MSAVGRPTKYSDKILKKARQYVGICKDNMDGTIPVVNLPSMGGLAVYLGITRETIYAWCKDKEKAEFSYIIEMLLAEQENRLINGGLSGAYKPTIAKVILTKHGYREGVDHTTNDKDLPTPILGGITKEQTDEIQ